MRRFGAFPPTEAQEEKGRRGNVLKHKVSLQLTSRTELHNTRSAGDQIQNPEQLRWYCLRRKHC